MMSEQAQRLPALVLESLAQHCGLAEAGWSGDERQPAIQTLVQVFDEVRGKTCFGGRKVIGVLLAGNISLLLLPSTFSTVARCPPPTPASGCSYRPVSAAIPRPTGGSWAATPSAPRRCSCSCTAPMPRNVSTICRSGGRKQQTPFVLTARLVLDSTSPRSPAQA